MNNGLTEQLTSCLKECLSEYGASEIISAESLAACAINKLDSEHSAPMVIEWACNLKLRDISRNLLRRNYESKVDDEEEAQVDMFESLQDRYPAKREGKHVYVPRLQLSIDERMANLKRMKSEVAEKQKHIDAFNQETIKLMEEGYFLEEKLSTSNP